MPITHIIVLICTYVHIRCYMVTVMEKNKTHAVIELITERWQCYDIL
jgi:hypothetical protein